MYFESFFVTFSIWSIKILFRYYVLVEQFNQILSVECMAKYVSYVSISFTDVQSHIRKSIQELDIEYWIENFLYNIGYTHISLSLSCDSYTYRYINVIVNQQKLVINYVNGHNIFELMKNMNDNRS